MVGFVGLPTHANVRFLGFLPFTSVHAKTTSSHFPTFPLFFTTLSHPSIHPFLFVLDRNCSRTLTLVLSPALCLHDLTLASFLNIYFSSSSFTLCVAHPQKRQSSFANNKQKLQSKSQPPHPPYTGTRDFLFFLVLFSPHIRISPPLCCLACI